MILQNSVGRQFEIYEQNYNFMMGILSNEMIYNYTQHLAEDNKYLSYVAAKMISAVIKTSINNNRIYEVWDGVKVKPLFNPSDTVILNLRDTVQPLTDKRKNFLLKLCDFLNRNNTITLIHNH